MWSYPQIRQSARQNEVGPWARGCALVRDSVGQVVDVQESIKAAMEEQNVGGKSILESLERLKSVSREVEGGSGSLRQASESIISETRSLVSITHEMSRGMDEMSQGTQEINDAVAEVVEMSQANSANIQAVKAEVERFKSRQP